MKRQPLNYATKAAQALRSYPMPEMPVTRKVMRFLADKLDQAEVFLLPEKGQLLDRSKPPLELPGTVFRPPFPVVACEYSVLNSECDDPYYNAVPSSRRIALAWEWNADELPYPLCAVPEMKAFPAGVAVASIFYVDATRLWLSSAGASHLSYDGQWLSQTGENRAPFFQTMVDCGKVSSAVQNAKAFEVGFIPLAVEHLAMAERQVGSMQGAVDVVRADMNDELIAYVDLCMALACKNVSKERHPASPTLNKMRRQSGKPLLKDFHVLDLAGSDSLGGAPGGGGAKRSHLRRGHIRRLAPDRIVWINQTIVRGGREGFLDKAYSMGDGK